MKRALLLVAAALTACGGTQTLTADEARNAMPSTSQAQLGTPQGGQALTAAGSAASGVTTADYEQDTVALSTAVNLGVAWPLGVLEVVTALPPTSCASDTCTWGPGSSALDFNTWQITVTKQAANDYLWTMQGKSKSDPGATWTSFVTGEAFTTSLKHVGHGAFVVDLDAAAALARPTTDTPQTGKISCTYDNTSGQNVSVQFIGTQDSTVPSQKVNAAYEFAASTTGGDMQIATRNLTTGAELQLHSRWTDVGAGRADASFADPSTAATYTRSECWSGAATLFNLTYESTTPPVATDFGVEAADCVFTPAALPTITIP